MGAAKSSFMESGIYCDYCGTLIEDRALKYYDETYSCKQCNSVAVLSSVEAEKILEDTLRWFGSYLGIVINKDTFKMQFYDRRELYKAIGRKYRPTKRYDHPPMLGYYHVTTCRQRNGFMKCLKKTFKGSFVLAFLFAVVYMLKNIDESLFSASGFIFILFSLLVVTLIYSVLLLPFAHYLIDVPDEIVILQGYGKDKTAQVIVHEIAHHVHGSTVLRANIHLAINLVFSPFFTSYTEGLADWVCKKYSETENMKFFSEGKPVRYRMGLHLMNFIEKIFGENFVVFLLRYI